MPSPSAIAHQWDLAAPVSAFCVNRRGDWVAAALGDGTMAMLPAREGDDAPQRVGVHEGIALSLVADADGVGFLSGGDDGKVCLLEPDAKAPTLLAEHKGKWIDHVAADDVGNRRAYAYGKMVQMLDEDGQSLGAPLEHGGGIGGLAFSPNGKRLAASHYNGVSLWWTNAKEQKPVKLEWKGAHAETIWHPDGKILLTSMQENALHGWRLADMAEMRMQGYQGKIHALGWTPKAKYLATSGAGQVICWPFFGGGPWGKAPLALGPDREALVAAVAPHPKDEMLAAGYADGMIIMAPLDGRSELIIHPPAATQGASVIGLVWNAVGDGLFAALENGTILLFTIESVSKLIRQQVGI